MLTNAECRYIEICTERIANPKTLNRELGIIFDVTERTIDRAIWWGKKKGLFTKNARTKINRHISEFQKHIDFLEAELKIIDRARTFKTLIDDEGNILEPYDVNGEPRDQTKYRTKKNKLPIGPARLAAVSRELRECRVIVMELEGIYKQTVNLQLGTVDLPAIQITGPDDYDLASSEFEILPDSNDATKNTQP